MKKLYTLVVAFVMTASAFAQAPEKMSYQAVVRDAGNAIVSNQAVGMQLSILQDATAVYVETQTPTTNANGLVSIQIGMGSVVSGDFSAIDWSAGPYFIKTETDPTGGTTYTITGTSELLSVPYALQAKNGIPSGGAEGQVLRIVNGLPVWVDNIGSDFDGDGFTVADGDCNDNDANINPNVPEIVGDAIDNNCNGVTDEPLVPAAVGDLRDGGVVFWVNPADNTHGLVCAMVNQSTGTQWYNGSYIDAAATALAIGTGSANTDAIISVQGSVETNYAAGLAKAYTGGGFTNWYLPSKDELNEIYLNQTTLAAIPGFEYFASVYWSSSEDNTYGAWEQYFGDGSQNNNYKDASASVRAVRSFGTPPPPPATVGDLRDGGVVFWVDPVDNTHGLVCTLSDVGGNSEWGCFGANLPSVPNVNFQIPFPFPSSDSGAEIGDGMTNTNGILTDCPTAPAALAARSLGSEWFLPSISELNEMYLNRATLEAVSGVATFSNVYWSSTEANANGAWFQNFSTGNASTSQKTWTQPNYVRAVRAF